MTPKLRIGPIGLDTNTLWLPSSQPIDFRAVGGPGLEILTPMGGSRLTVEGGANYTYYLKTQSQRRWAGDGRARFDVGGDGPFRAGVEQSYVRNYGRPALDVDRRVIQDQWLTRADLTMTLHRLSLVPVFTYQRDAVPEHPDFLGTDLTRSLTRRQLRGTLGMKYSLTPKTSLLVAGDEQVDRFRFDAIRDADGSRFYGGLELVSSTRLAGRATGGVSVLRFRGTRDVPGVRHTGPYADMEVQYHFGPKTRLEATFRQDLAYSSLDVQGAAPSLTTRHVGARFSKDLWRGLDIVLFGSYDQFLTKGAVSLTSRDGGAETGTRDDGLRQAGADLGVRIRHLRLGVAAIYANRLSTFRDLRFRGLIVGGTITFLPTAGISGLSWPR